MGRFDARKDNNANKAKERIAILFSEAENSDLEIGRRQIMIARRIAMKYNIRLGRDYKKRFCKKCSAYLTSKNSRVRLEHGKMAITCLACGNIRRMIYKK
jgi:ribonuclease P protein subunit RPR2